MNRAVKAGERWSTFIFDGVDCADLGVYAITNGSTYTTNLAPAFSDKKTTVTAYDGQYYYGTQITGQKFTLNMFAENLSYQELSKLKSWLNPRHIGKIIFSDQPFKYYYVKPTSVGALANIPLTDVQTPASSVLGDFMEGNLVYVGKFTVTFETVGSAYGYGLGYFRDDLIYDALNHYGIGHYSENYFYDSGLLYKDMCPAMYWEHDVAQSNGGVEQSVAFYNPGDAKCYPRFILNLSDTVPNGGLIHFKNKSTNEACSIDLKGLTGEIAIDFTEQTVSKIITNTSEDGTVTKTKIPYYGRITGNAISINGKQDVIAIPDTVTENIEDFYITEYDTIYVQNEKGTCRVTINPMAVKVHPDWVGMYFCINGNGGAKIIQVDTETNTCFLSNTPITHDIPPAKTDANGKITTPAGFPCNFIDIQGNLENVPASPKTGDVYTYEDKWYIYKENSWKETNLFDDKEQFRNMTGDYVTQYLIFGANVVKLDDLVYTTTNMPTFTMGVEVLPRYV